LCCIPNIVEEIGNWIATSKASGMKVAIRGAPIALIIQELKRPKSKEATPTAYKKYRKKRSAKTNT